MTKFIAAAKSPAGAVAGAALALVATGIITALKLRSRRAGILSMDA
jgi:hypothetical protein